MFSVSCYTEYDRYGTKIIIVNAVLTPPRQNGLLGWQGFALARLLIRSTDPLV